MSALIKARRDHRCSICERRIRKGTTYYRENLTPWNGSGGDGFGVWKAHKRCEEAYWDLPQYWRDQNDGWVDPYEFRVEMMFQRYPNVMEGVMTRRNEALDAARKRAMAVS